MRLGDYVDDYCSRCKRTTDHAVVSMEGEEVQKVRCRTCSYEHKYRHNKTGKKELTKEEAFQKVLASVTGQLGGLVSRTAQRRGQSSGIALRSVFHDAFEQVGFQLRSCADHELRRGDTSRRCPVAGQGFFSPARIEVFASCAAGRPRLSSRSVLCRSRCAW